MDPGVVVGALDACVQPQGLSRQLSGCQGARVGQAAEGLTLHRALALPLLEVPERHSSRGVLHPLDNLELGGEVNVIVGGGNVGHPLVEDVSEALVGDQPGWVEREGEGSSVGAIVSLKVVVQQLPGDRFSFQSISL